MGRTSQNHCYWLPQDRGNEWGMECGDKENINFVSLYTLGLFKFLPQTFIFTFIISQ